MLSLGIQLKRFGQPEADLIFAEFGMLGKTIEQIERKLKIKRTKLRMFLNKIENEGEETANEDFYSLKSRYGTVVGHIPVDVLLIEWIGHLNTIKEMNKIKNNGRN